MTSRNELIRTATILTDFGEPHKAAGYLVQAKEYLKAAQLYETTGDTGKAGDCYFRAGKYELALKMYARAGRKDKRMARLYEEHGFYHEAAVIWKLLGNTRKWQRCMRKFREPTLFD